MTTCLATVTIAPRTSEVRELAIPAVGSDSGLLRVDAAGVCGSDVGAWSTPATPRILGHENVGTVAAIGADASRRWGVTEGDRVVLEEYLPCGHCPTCRTTEFRFCAETDSRGGGIRYGSTGVDHLPGLWGGYSQYLYLHPRSVLHRIAGDTPARRLALALPVANGYQWACVDGGAAPGRAVMVIGPGQQGLSCAYAAKQAGADVVAVVGRGADRRRLDVALELGADLALDSASSDSTAQLLAATGGEGFDLIIDTARGDAATIGLAVEMCRQQGTILLATGGDRVDNVPVRSLQWKCLDLRGVRGHSYAAVEWAIAVLGRRSERISGLTTHHFPLAEVDRAIGATAGEDDRGAIHVTVHPWEDIP